MTQEFHLSVTPVGEDEYLIRTERVAPGVPLAEEQVVWPVEEWLNQARQLMNDPLLGLLQEDVFDPGIDKLHNPGNRELELVLGGSEPNQNLPPRHLVALGQQLYNALFQGTIRDSWMTAQGIAQHRREVLRLRLGLKGARLVRLPWEVLHTGERHRVGGASRPLATGTDVLFSRYQPSPGLVGATTALRELMRESQQPLKILMAIAAPTDQEQLELKREALHLQEELRSRHGTASEAGGSTAEIQLTILDQPDREQLTQALEQGQFQVLHYAGHSNLGAAGGNLYLVNGKTGLTEVLSGDDLAGLLVNNGIRMVVFNSCRSAYTATSDLEHEIGEQNLAEALVQRGIPGVLAMAERIPDDVALTLTRLFYRNLKQGYPVDLSLSRARQGLISAYGSHQLYWALPILYLHPEFDGQLITGNVPDLYSAAQEMATARWRSPSDRPTNHLTPLGEVHHSGLTDEEAFLASAQSLNGIAADLEDDPYDYGDEDLGELDDLEFDDEFGSEADSALVAELIEQLSKNPTDPQLTAEEPFLSAPAAENLRSESQRPPYLDLPGSPKPQPTSPKSTPPRNPPPQTQPSTNSAIDPRLSQVFSDLEQGLAAPTNASTAIATARRAIQANPNDVDAYNQLGLALYQQGNFADAIAAYQAALKINPSLAEVYSNLALALYKQGKVAEAKTAYQQAVSLAALPGGTNSTAGRNSALQPEYPRRSSNGWGAWLQQPRRRSKLWLILAAAGVTAIALFGFWWFQRNRSPQVSIPALPESISNNSNNSFAIDPQTNQTTLDLKATNTATVTAAAIDYLSRKQLVAGQQAIAELLDRGALPQASAALAAVPNTVIDDPAVSFLRGRLAWQSMQTGNQDYSVDDARRYWETAVRQQAEAEQTDAASLALYQNALGFAYYAEQNWDRANRAWFQALYLQEEAQTTTPSEPGVIATTPTAATAPAATARPGNQENLMAYAGLALVLAKSAQNQPAEQRANLQNEALKLYQKVMTENPVAFQPDALSKNWMWTESTIKDWGGIAKLQPQT
ncbi:CHAT domain-containing protein [Trichocoleus desertorum AS-A10]|uniref:CHAT domain-containing protein n=1 Tax=Trichocoleus desertorum TaxID=1481672 RepID=UPI0032987BB8